MTLLSVDDALKRILKNATPLDIEPVSLIHAHKRLLRQDVAATLTQPPFDASSMDGYAVRAEDVLVTPVELELIGESAAGHGFKGEVTTGQATRIFTGAPVPQGADCVIMQENTTREGTTVTIQQGAEKGNFIRPAGFDFKEGACLIKSGRPLTDRDIALSAAMGHGVLNVSKRPKVAILATGDELVYPGEIPGPDQIIASNGYALVPMIEKTGATPRLLDIARDTPESLDACIKDGADADILVTIGGASVGDHDLVNAALSARGMELDFWKIAMRPGKPLMFGRLSEQYVLGLPGNPVSSYICALVFLIPLIRALLGHQTPLTPLKSALLANNIEANGVRQHFLRGKYEKIKDPGGNLVQGVTAYSNQDSARLALLHEADCLIVREVNAPALEVGEQVKFLPLN